MKYLVTGATGFVDALHLAEKITGVPAPRIQVAPSIMKMMAATMGLVEKVIPVLPDYSSEYLRTVQKNLTVPQQQKGPALSSLRFAQGLRQGQALSAASRSNVSQALRMTRQRARGATTRAPWKTD